MKIALASPLIESVPPRAYGGTERIVCYLAEELVRAGHDVTVYASGDSTVRARVVRCCPRALRFDPDVRDPLAQHLLQMERIDRDRAQFDIVHFHNDYVHFPFSRRSRMPHLTTLHGRLDLPDLVPLYREYRDMPLVSISDAQRRPLPRASWIATVHHGLPADLLSFHLRPEGYLAFVGRISREKRPDRAIRIATASGLPLRIAAKVDPADREYFEREIEPLLGAPGVEFVGEITDAEKDAFLGNALGLLFPIDWPEPFGLVMLEALATGTPVLAFRNGSVPEILEDGVTGFVVDDMDEALAAVGRLETLDRRRCRAAFERRFTAARMARDYVAIYERVLESGTEVHSFNAAAQ